MIHDGRNGTNKLKKNRKVGEKETYIYLEIMEADTIKQVEMKEKFKKLYLRRTKKLLETKLYCGNLIKGINTWAAPPCKILGTILKVDLGRTPANGAEHKKTHDDT